jgi:hypothetical protein
MTQDPRYALRILVKSQFSTAVAFPLLALGTGAASAISSLVRVTSIGVDLERRSGPTAATRTEADGSH